MIKQLDTVLFEKHTNSLYIGIVVKKVILDKLYLLIYENNAFYLHPECETELQNISKDAYNLELKKLYKKLTKKEYSNSDTDLVSILSTVIEKTK